MYKDSVWCLTRKFGIGKILFILDYGRSENPCFMVRLDGGIVKCFDMTQILWEGDLSQGLPEPDIKTFDEIEE